MSPWVNAESVGEQAVFPLGAARADDYFDPPDLPAGVGPGWGARWRSATAGRRAAMGPPSRGLDRARAAARAAELPAATLDPRTVHGGSVHSPIVYAALQPRLPPAAESMTPWSSARDYTAFGRPGPVHRPLKAPEPYSGPWGPSLGGFLEDSLRRRFQAALARLQAIIGRFLVSKNTLISVQRGIAVARERAGTDPAIPETQRRELYALSLEADRLLDNQSSLESELATANQKVQKARAALEIDDQASPNLGIAPILGGVVALVAAAAAAVVLVVGKVIIHISSVRSLRNQLGAVAAGILTPAELSAIKESDNGAAGGIFAGFGEGLGKALPFAVGAGLLFFFARRGR